MGTRSLIIMRVKKTNGTYIIYAVLYQQYDGSPEGVGSKLFNFLNNMKVVNGIRSSYANQKVANGAGDLFAQIIGIFKDQVGDAYLCESIDEDLQEYNYYVTVDENKEISVSVTSGGREVLFSGNADEMLTFFKLDEDESGDIPYKVKV